MDTRPRIEIVKSDKDKMIEYLGWAVALCSFVMVAYYYPSLPDQIPQHFNAKGDVDAYGSKELLWLLPIIGFVTFSSLMYLNKFPHIMNTPFKITKENAEKHYGLLLEMNRLLAVGIVLLFLYITTKIILIATEKATSLGSASFVIMLLAVFAPIVIYFIKASKVK